MHWMQAFMVYHLQWTQTRDMATNKDKEATIETTTLSKK